MYYSRSKTLRCKLFGSVVSIPSPLNSSWKTKCDVIKMSQKQNWHLDSQFALQNFSGCQSAVSAHTHQQSNQSKVKFGLYTLFVNHSHSETLIASSHVWCDKTPQPQTAKQNFNRIKTVSFYPNLHLVLILFRSWSHFLLTLQNTGTKLYFS